MAIPIISDLFERLFGPSEDIHSRDDVKRRLKIVLAHDRLALDPQTLEMMRQEIIAVVSRYVEVDFDALEFYLATNDRVTALTANLPIRRIRPLGTEPDQPISADEEAANIELATQSDILTLDEDETVDRIGQPGADQPNGQPVQESLDIDRSEQEDDAAIAQKTTASTTSSNSDLDQVENLDYEATSEADNEAINDEPAMPEVPDMSIPDAPVQTVGKPASQPNE